MAIETNRVLHQPSEGESTPLLSSPKGGGRLKPQAQAQHHRSVQDGAGTDGSITRRRFNQQQHQQQQQQSQHFASPFHSQSDTQTNHTDDNSKKGRLGNLHLKCTTCTKTIRDCIFPPSRSSRSGFRSTATGGGRAVGHPPVDRIVYTEDTDAKVFYEDKYNDLPWSCTFGTREVNGIWVNRTDANGITMSAMVWLLIVYSGFTVTLLAQNNSLRPMIATIYCTLCALALACHVKTAFTDPGSVPYQAVPTEEQGMTQSQFPLCSICLTFKPERCHHCRICDRCICGMDHHCPWMNNCIGSGNLKHFILFLIYVWTLAVYAFVVFGMNYFFCASEECVFTPVLVQLVRVMTLMSVGALIFSTNMIINVTYGIMTGTGTIDRMKKSENNTVWDSDEESIPLKDVFGIAGWYTWPFPVDPLFEDYDKVMGYSTTQRLLREQAARDSKNFLSNCSVAGSVGGFENV